MHFNLPYMHANCIFFKYAVRKQIELHKHAVCSSIPPLNLRLHVTFQGRQKLNWLIILKPIIGRGWHAREISADEGQSKDVLSRRSQSLQETHHAVGETAWHFRNSTSLRRAACTPILCPASAILSFDFFFFVWRCNVSYYVTASRNLALPHVQFRRFQLPRTPFSAHLRVLLLFAVLVTLIQATLRPYIRRISADARK